MILHPLTVLALVALGAVIGSGLTWVVMESLRVAHGLSQYSAGYERGRTNAMLQAAWDVERLRVRPGLTVVGHN